LDGSNARALRVSAENKRIGAAELRFVQARVEKGLPLNQFAVDLLKSHGIEYDGPREVEDDTLQIMERLRVGKNRVSDPQIIEASKCAHEMERQRAESLPAKAEDK